MKVKIIGAGLAGCEAAWQCANRGIEVALYEMRPKKMTPAHKTAGFAELVCSNSLRSNALTNAVGVLKEEMRMLDSLIMAVADKNALPAGSALAVDRELFSKQIEEKIRSHPKITVIEEELTSIPEDTTIICSGPLTSDALSLSIQECLEEDAFYFYDAAAPIVEKQSINFDIAYYKSRYDKGDADYINCPMNKEQFYNFYHELIQAKTVPLKEFEKEIFFEGCMPFEEIARRGEKTLLFGPMKPVGLGKEGEPRPYAVVQLRQDNVADSLYNIVGFQTHLTWPEQKRIISMIPGLEQVNIVRYGVMHRNSYINSPQVLESTYQCKKRDNLFFAGQITGVEGYVESAASGLLAGINCAHLLLNKPLLKLEADTMIGAMAYYISHGDKANFQPMNANFGIMRLNQQVKKHERKEAYSKQALDIVKKWDV